MRFIYFRIRFSQVSLFLIVSLAITLFSLSCKKNAGNANAKFLGTYSGTNCKDSIIPDVVITAGANGSLVIVTIPVDTGGCTTNLGITGSVNGNSITFATQSLNDLCGNALLVSGTGSLINNILSLDISGLYQLSGNVSGGSGAYCFTGSK